MWRLQPKNYIASDHEIDRNSIDADALAILKKLQEAGFVAYLVGGSVRDLLVGKKPKDFDISTSAEPEQIKRLFQRSCILIGRRFRLAHIRYGKKIFEVSTFRAAGENEGDLILQDNEWGTAAEDVLRRDFTINGLFYDPTTHSIIDYVGGWNDIHSRKLKAIGNAAVRFKQDPVRMIRLLKFKARFPDFEVDAPAIEALVSCKDEIAKSSPARILEETFRMLESGASAPFFQLMTDHGLLQLLYPLLANSLQSPLGKEIYQYLAGADRINTHFGPGALERSVLGACLLFPLLQQAIKEEFVNKEISPHLGDIIMLTSSLIKEMVISSFSHFPRRISTEMGYILSTQYRLTPLSGKCTYRNRVAQHKEFVLALKLLKLRSLVNPQLAEAYFSWKNLYLHQEKHRDRKPHSHHPSPRRKLPSSK